MKKLIYLIATIVFLQSCTESKQAAIQEISTASTSAVDSLTATDEVFAMHGEDPTKEISTKNDAGKLWLEGLFKCKTGNRFCFYLNTEEKATTKRFYEFMIDSEQIFGASSLSEAELPAAKEKYRQKWSQIYPLRKDMEPWLFGRAQDDMENIETVKIDKTGDLKYQVYVDYGESYQTLNQVTLVKNNGSFLIDYCDTEYFD